ncbi:LOW QUALITY PROTEIN: interferon regulatory factor 4a [Phyllopteryx taeniolatus]|uniref:LOW QUALITY PROTEIN: interferon regulatory factor 4a n=1 Tax=Phyllopteryx taeniolatus TaxID=161469 RepID=UPI002AD455E1|nr:LOW QUALITY PROTEIN: interferon regulatory factor 4a [Phyllopteryx taeniolatus]
MIGVRAVSVPAEGRSSRHLTAEHLFCKVLRTSGSSLLPAANRHMIRFKIRHKRRESMQSEATCLLKEMNLEEHNGPAAGCCNGKLRQWLIDQINSKKYPGLVWENHEKTIFRIPWKHAGKQDYNREEDAALFKAWALFKGKYKEGVDKPDHTTWKTRLRCALNKSNDFDELTHRTQLDILEPYKVYRIIPEAAKRGTKMSASTEGASRSFDMIPPYSTLLSQEIRDWRDCKRPEQHPVAPVRHCGSHAEFPYSQFSSAIGRAWPEPQSENGFPFPFHPCMSEAQQPLYTTDDSSMITDFSLHVSLFYRESLVKEVTTSSPEGCRITPHSSSSPSPPSTSPCPPEIHSGADIVLFPLPFPESQRQGAERLPDILERGVMLWMTPDGLYARRLCRGRVFWEGPLAPYVDKPNKLEKDMPCKLFDTQQFLNELQDFAHNGRRVPKHQVVLCFGDEYPNPQRPRKMITAQVEPVFARNLFNYYQQSNGHYSQTYQHTREQNTSGPNALLSQRPSHI